MTAESLKKNYVPLPMGTAQIGKSGAAKLWRLRHTGNQKRRTEFCECVRTCPYQIKMPPFTVLEPVLRPESDSPKNSLRIPVPYL